MRTWRIAELLEVSTGYLRERGCSSPRLDAELLLAEVLGVGRVDLYTQYDRPLDAHEVDAYRALIARRARREPVAYILGRAPFRYLTLEVTPATLIPRPETEELVDAELDHLRTHPVLEMGAARVVDVGTGSGAIALSLATEAGVRVLAVDVSEEAVAVAARNAARFEVDSLVELRVGDLLTGVPDGSLDVVVANLPYVPDWARPKLEPDVRDYEPGSALFAAEDGLVEIRRLLPQAAAALRPGGALFLEVGLKQASAVVEAALAAGFSETAVIRDLGGKDRIVRAVKTGCRVVQADTLDDGDHARLGNALAAGAIIGVPTDTVYGLAAAWDNASGVSRLFAAKGRDEERPVGVVFSSVEEIVSALPDLDEVAAHVLRDLLPGPYTFIVATRVARPRLVGTEDSLGVRVVDHPPLPKVLAAAGMPLALTSANRSGGPDVERAADVDPAVLDLCAVAFEAGSAFPDGVAPEGGPPPLGSVLPAPAQSSGIAPPAGAASTVMDLRSLSTGGEPVVVREGAVSAGEALRRVAAAQSRCRSNTDPCPEPVTEDRS